MGGKNAIKSTLGEQRVKKQIVLVVIAAYFISPPQALQRWAVAVGGMEALQRWAEATTEAQEAARISIPLAGVGGRGGNAKSTRIICLTIAPPRVTPVCLKVRRRK